MTSIGIFCVERRSALLAATRDSQTHAFLSRKHRIHQPYVPATAPLWCIVYNEHPCLDIAGCVRVFENDAGCGRLHVGKLSVRIRRGGMKAVDI